jgi:hypothetical protein
MAWRADGGDIGCERRACWAQPGRGGRVAASHARLRFGGAGRWSSIRQRFWETVRGCFGGQGARDRAVGARAGTSRDELARRAGREGRKSDPRASVRQVWPPPSQPSSCCPPRRVMATSPGVDGRLVTCLQPARDLERARCPPLRPRVRAEGRRAGEGQMRPEPGRSTRPVRTSVPPAASLPRESSWPSRRAPQGAWPREPAQAGRGIAMARAETVRRSGALDAASSIGPGSPGP